MEIEKLKQVVYEAAFEVREHLGPGFLENVYKNALYLEIISRGLNCKTEAGIIVEYKGHHVGEYRADMLVEDQIILELKAVDSLHPQHEAQLVNYLTATGINDGILINFGNQYAFRHKKRIYHK